MSTADKVEAVGVILVALGFLTVAILLEQQNRQLRQHAERLRHLEVRTDLLARETHRAFTGWHDYFFAREQEPKA